MARPAPLTPEQRKLVDDFDRLHEPNEFQVALFRKQASELGLSEAYITETLALKWSY